MTTGYALGRMDRDPKKKADGWGTLGRGKLGHCRQLPHGDNEEQDGTDGREVLRLAFLLQPEEPTGLMEE